MFSYIGKVKILNLESVVTSNELPVIALISYWLFKILFPPCKGIRIPESRNFLLVESAILGFGIRNPALGIRNPSKDWNPESKLLKIHSRLD